MPTLPVYDLTGSQSGEVIVPEEWFEVEAKEALFHEVVVADLAAKRQGTASAKTRAEVSGSGRKLWRQKGTGRARVGDRRPPHRSGGGVVNEPTGRDYRQRLPRQVQELALRGALSARMKAGELVLLDSLLLPEAKTRALKAILDVIGANSGSLLVLTEHDALVVRAGRNIAGLKISDAQQVNAREVLAARKVIMEKDALARLESRLS